MKTVFALLLSAVALSAQTAPLQTTLTAAVTTDASQVHLASVTGLAVGGQLFVDREAMKINGIAAKVVTVQRGVEGTRASAHPSGSTVYGGAPSVFAYADPPAGSCTANPAIPWINVQNGLIWNCTSNVWVSSNGPGGGSLSVTIGTVTTLAAGEDATVTNVGTAEEPVLDFGIPAGAAGSGDDGADGLDGVDGVDAPAALEIEVAQCGQTDPAYAGAATPGCFGTTVKYPGLTFADGEANEHQFSFFMPAGLTDLSGTAVWRSTQTSGDKVWNWSYRCPASGTAIDGSFTSVGSTTTTTNGTANSPNYSTRAAVAPTACAGRQVFIKLDSSDALTGGAILTKILLFVP